jgi:hypothetical protein
MQLSPEQPYTGLLTAGSDLVAALDTAISSLYPTQDVAEIYGAVGELNTAGRALATAFKTRLAQGTAGEVERKVADAFADKWVARLELEAAGWGEKALGMSELAAALE